MWCGKKFWVLGLRNALRSIKHLCQMSETKLHSISTNNFRSATRTVSQRICPFYTRVDFFGPFEVNSLRRSLKRWCCLFTYIATRAVYIEIDHSLDTESCLAAISRFFAKRGQPTNILSGYGTIFVGAAKELKEQITNWNQQEIKEELTLCNIFWKFNPPGAPHFGAIWECLVRRCKKQ